MQSKLTDVLYEKKEYSFFVWQSCCVRGGGNLKEKNPNVVTIQQTDNLLKQSLAYQKNILFRQGSLYILWSDTDTKLK